MDQRNDGPCPTCGCEPIKIDWEGKDMRMFVDIERVELDRLLAIEAAAREYLIAGGIQDTLYHETSISDAARRAASDNYCEKKEALRLALRDTSGKGE